MAHTHLDPGEELEVSSRAYFYAGKSDITSLVKLPMEELTELEQGSIREEEAIYAKIKELECQWLCQAARTKSIRKAKGYLRTMPVTHTFNKWVENEYGWHEISNMVYTFGWRSSEKSHWDRGKGKSVVTGHTVTWHIFYNTPRNPDYSGSGRKIAGQEDKYFADKAGMEKYLQGRINAYAHLFTELSPPIPKGEERRFSVNGVLLPGYTVEVPEKTPQEVASELLDFLEDEDTPVPAELPPQPPKPSRPAHGKHPPRKRDKTAPTR